MLCAYYVCLCASVCTKLDQFPLRKRWERKSPIWKVFYNRSRLRPWFVILVSKCALYLPQKWRTRFFVKSMNIPAVIWRQETNETIQDISSCWFNVFLYCLRFRNQLKPVIQLWLHRTPIIKNSSIEKKNDEKFRFSNKNSWPSPWSMSEFFQSGAFFEGLTNLDLNLFLFVFSRSTLFVYCAVCTLACAMNLHDLDRKLTCLCMCVSCVCVCLKSVY